MTRINGMVEAAQRAAEVEMYERQRLEALRLSVAGQVFSGLVVDVVGPQLREAKPDESGQVRENLNCHFGIAANVASQAAVEFMVANGFMKVVDRQKPDAG